MPRFQTLTDLIDQACYELQGVDVNKPENGNRRHLGASVIGKRCARDIWYSFRWARSGSSFPGRVLRLFNRGQLEEARVITWLQMIGAQVTEIDPDSIHGLWYHPESDSYVVTSPTADESERGSLAEQGCDDVTEIMWHQLRAKARNVDVPAPRQFGFKGIMGHFAGSMDGKALFPMLSQGASLPPVFTKSQHLDAYYRLIREMLELGITGEMQLLLEFKTHGLASYEKLVAANSVRAVKPEHYAQMVVYMDEHQLQFAVYSAVCKNDDDLYFEIIRADPEHAAEMRAKAGMIIHSRTPPSRISKSPSWFECKFCDHRKECHYGAPLALNCRTCRMSVPIDGGNWFCERWGKQIPQAAEADGCGHWAQIND